MTSGRVRTAYLSIGSNVDRRRNIARALSALAASFDDLRVSGVYACPAAGFEGNDFYNLAASVRSDQSPEDISVELKRIEASQGRKRTDQRFSDRVIDIDLLMLDDLCGEFGLLQLPRRDIHEYYFVLGPLAELEPGLIDPVSGSTMAELWALMQPGLSQDEVLRLVD